ncbi:DUF6756 family protein [Paenibacillus tundrae]
MESLSVRLEIEELIKKCSINRQELFEVRKDQWKSILDHIEKHFLKKTHYTQDLHWGWNRLREPHYALRFNEQPYRSIKEIIADEWIWFIAEDYNDKMWIYEGDKNIIFDKIIPELYHLDEYFLVSKKYEWLVCEDHHEIVHFSGEGIIHQAKKFELENESKIFK